jgi:hypothetical protein
MSYNSPINFDPGKDYPECKDTCKFVFKYADSACTVRKFKIFDQHCLFASYETGNTSTNVSYNGINYYPSGCFIFAGSFHTYSGAKSDGELVIIHEGSGGTGAGKLLLVCIPMVVVSGSLSGSGEIIDQIIKAVPKTQVDKQSDTSPVFNVSGLYNLSNIIPSGTAPYYTYTGNAFYSNRSEAINYIVYTKSSECAISKEGYTHLTSVIKPIVTPAISMPVNAASLNTLGANATSSNEIYIECKPTGADGVILYKKSLKGDGAESAIGDESLNPESGDIFQNRAFLIGITIICCILFIGTITYIITWMLRAVSKNKTGEGAARAAASATAGK